jgi:peptide/nickel transport system permease protein
MRRRKIHVSLGERKRRRLERRRFWRKVFFRNYLVTIGTALLFIVIAASLIGPEFSSVDPLKLHWRERNKPPSAEHLLGTDTYGRDQLIVVLYGGRNSLSIAATVTVITVSLATLIGIAAPWFRSIDNILMRVMDVMMSIPSMILAIALVGFLGASRTNVIIAIVLTQTPRFARVVRSAVMSVRELTYIEAAQALGVSSWRIMFRHILPNCLGPIMVQATFLFAHAILVESSLSFIGVGTPPPIPSWGNLMAEGRKYISSGWWLTIIPGAALSMSVLGLNIFGDGLRDTLDPRLRGLR